MGDEVGVDIKMLSGSVPEDVKSNAVQAFESADQVQIIAESLGALLTDCAYSYKQGDQIVTGLSYTGVKIGFRKKYGSLPSLKREYVTWEIDPKDGPRARTFVCHIYIPEATGSTPIIPGKIYRAGEPTPVAPCYPALYSVAEQPDTFTYRSGTQGPDYHARKKCLSKSFRNVLMSALTEQEVYLLLERILAGKEEIEKGKYATVRQLDQRDTKGQADLDPRRKAMLARFHTLGKMLGVNVNNDKGKEMLHALIAGVNGKGLSEMDEPKLRAVGDELNAISKANRGGKFIELVEACDVGGYEDLMREIRNATV